MAVRNPTPPAGANTQIQYNNAGAFGASARFTWTDSLTSVLQVGKDGDTSATVRPQATTAGNGVDLTLQAGTSSDAAAGAAASLNLLGADGNPNAVFAGGISIKGGNGVFANTQGGTIIGAGGDGSGTATGGTFQFTGGKGGPTNGNGGSISFIGGSGQGSGVGGSITFQPGGSITGGCGSVTATLSGPVAANNGSFNVTTSNTTSGNAGSINFTAGRSTTGAPGSINLTANTTAAGLAGDINLKTKNVLRASVQGASGIFKLQVLTVATLPAAATVGTGGKSMVSDALAPAFGAAVVGGGAVTVPVYTDGATWFVG